MRPSAVGVDIFAGGFTLGVRERFDVLAHLEHGTYGVKTAQLNLPSLPIYVGKNTWPFRFERHVDLVYANPPCAIWSMAANTTNHHDAWRTDPRTRCIHDVMDLLSLYSPTVLVWETCDGGWTRGQPLLRELETSARTQGYEVTHVRIDAQYLGVAHVRKRYFFVASRVQLYWPTTLLPPISVKTALRGIDPGEVVKQPSSSFVKLWHRTPPGKDLRRFMRPSDHVKGKVPGFFVRRNPVDVPARTVMCGELMHHAEPRFCTFNEFKALCGFPPEFRLAKRTTPAAMSELFRGVMPPIAKWLAEVLYNGIKRDEAAHSLTNLCDFRDPKKIRIVQPLRRFKQMTLDEITEGVDAYKVVA